MHTCRRVSPVYGCVFFFFSSRRRHTRCSRDWSSDVCSSDLNAFGLDAAAIGNHELDWSVDTLRARMAEAHYRFLAANITDTTGRARPDWAEPWTLLERGGQKIAVIGLALRATPTNTAPRNVTGLA